MPGEGRRRSTADSMRKGPRRQRRSKREQLIETALELFAKQGFHATGIDTILARSGVSKRTLYLHFRSKEELVLAVLRRYEETFRRAFIGKVESLARTPRGQLPAIFDAVEEWFKRKDFYGCLFINAVGEHSESATPLRRVCQEYKRSMREYVRTLCKQAGARDPDGLAEALALLVEGATVTAQVSQNPKAAQIAKQTAELLLDRALPQTVGGRG